MIAALPQKIFAVSPTTVRETRKVSYIFMFNGMPREKWDDLPNTWGYLELKRKGPNHLDPFKLMQGRPGAIGDDGVRRWNLNLFNSDGFVRGGGGDEDPESCDEGLRQLFEGCPECVLLMSREALERFQVFCQAQGIELDVTLHEGELPTS